MRTIKFRGKRIDNGEWAYGSYIENSIDSPCIIDYDADQFEVHPESIGQFIGLTIEGTEIYEGDEIGKDYGDGMESLGKVNWNEEVSGWRIGEYNTDIRTLNLEALKIIN